ncbi:MAG: thermonuclease family protein [Halofilum sp. (in: g-proteobacteria)]|nr:thermonuclease family protein [Halofilum sp. (in: g-proteobacteria)]
MFPGRIPRKAPLWGALLFALALPAQALECPPDRIDRRARVAHVFDGDTVRLADGTPVRFIGINTPEHGRDGAPDEPFAAAATAALRELLAAHGQRLALRLGAQRRDRHDRLLAHAYLPDGRSISRILLEHGLALHITVPPDTWNHRCYAAAERAARAGGRGLWEHPRYRGVAAAALPPDAAGFRVVEGRVRRVGESGRAWWLELDGLTLRLAKADLAYFEGTDPRDLLDVRIRVRGWIYRVRGEARMNLRHPDALEHLS